MNEIRLVTASVKIVTSRLCLATIDRPVDPPNPTGGGKAAARQRADDFLMSRVCLHFPVFSSRLDGNDCDAPFLSDIRNLRRWFISPVYIPLRSTNQNKRQQSGKSIKSVESIESTRCKRVWYFSSSKADLNKFATVILVEKFSARNTRNVCCCISQGTVEKQFSYERSWHFEIFQLNGITRNLECHDRFISALSIKESVDLFLSRNPLVWKVYFLLKLFFVEPIVRKTRNSSLYVVLVFHAASSIKIKVNPETTILYVCKQVNAFFYSEYSDITPFRIIRFPFEKSTRPRNLLRRRKHH